MSLWQFVGDHPVLTFFLAWFAVDLAGKVINLPFRFWNRWLRHRNIVSHGWPPEHLDADGDFRPLPKTDEATA